MRYSYWITEYFMDPLNSHKYPRIVGEFLTVAPGIKYTQILTPNARAFLGVLPCTLNRRISYPTCYRTPKRHNPLHVNYASLEIRTINGIASRLWRCLRRKVAKCSEKQRFSSNEWRSIGRWVAKSSALVATSGEVLGDG